jgi:hypothetical protein
VPRSPTPSGISVGVHPKRVLLRFLDLLVTQRQVVKRIFSMLSVTVGPYGYLGKHLDYVQSLSFHCLRQG